jgi:hypothetical protein
MQCYLILIKFPFSKKKDASCLFSAANMVDQDPYTSSAPSYRTIGSKICSDKANPSDFADIKAHTTPENYLYL